MDERRRINGHTLELHGLWWKCLQCGHSFDAATEANAFWCGEPCACIPHIVGRPS